MGRTAGEQRLRIFTLEAELDVARAELTHIRESKSFRVLRTLGLLRRVFAPPGGGVTPGSNGWLKNSGQGGTGGVVIPSDLDNFCVPLAPIPRVVAHFLPQFRALEENSEAWGEYFTEWSNVLQGVPLFDGHRQPRIPPGGEIYSLEDPKTLRSQVSIAKTYGVAAFSYYFYFFDRAPVLGETIRQHAEDSLCDIDFSLTWANENWTKKWDGGDDGIIFEQTYSSDLPERLANAVSPYLVNGKYLRTLDGRPIFSVYRPAAVPNPRQFFERFRKAVQQETGADLYLQAFQTFDDFTPPQRLGFDGAAEFPPHPFPANQAKKTRQLGAYSNLNPKVSGVRPDFRGNFFSYGEYATLYSSSDDVPYSLARGVMLEWDNSPRNPSTGNIFVGFDYRKFSAWLVRSLVREDRADTGASVVYINAWNEWGEGAVLEAREDDGNSALEAVRHSVSHAEVIRQSLADLANFGDQKATSDSVAHIHLHAFRESKRWAKVIEQIAAHGIEVIVTTTSAADAARVRAETNCTAVFVVENRGRDIRPFLQLLPYFRKKGFTYVLKIHGKESRHRGLAGYRWGRDLIEGYASTELLREALHKLRSNAEIGMICSLDQLSTTSLDQTWIHNLAIHDLLVQALPAHRTKASEFPTRQFPAGSMFWARLDAIESLAEIQDSWFELELPGASTTDGRLEHSVERLFLQLVLQSGHELQFFRRRFGSPA
jgi:lipopolysaccharide biosynthesis protein